MRLMRIGAFGAEKPAVNVDDRILDMSAHVEDYDGAFFDGGGLDRLEDLVATHAGSLPEVDMSAERIGACIARPHKVLAIGLNYSDHAAEAKLPLPEEPLLFTKPTNTVVGPNDNVLLPPGAEKVDYEVELGAVIGQSCRYLPDERAAEAAIAGYCIANDVSERTYQLDRGGQFTKGKSCETFNPLGPWLVTPDEVGDPHALRMTTKVNDVVRQDGNTADMIFGVPHIVWYLSQFMVLEPGDLIITGTPAGVAMGMAEPGYLVEEDVMTLTIEKLGQQRSVCERATA